MPNEYPLGSLRTVLQKAIASKISEDELKAEAKEEPLPKVITFRGSLRENPTVLKDLVELLSQLGGSPLIRINIVSEDSPELFSQSEHDNITEEDRFVRGMKSVRNLYSENSHLTTLVWFEGGPLGSKEIRNMQAQLADKVNDNLNKLNKGREYDRYKVHSLREAIKVLRGLRSELAEAKGPYFEVPEKIIFEISNVQDLSFFDDQMTQLFVSVLHDLPIREVEIRCFPSAGKDITSEKVQEKLNALLKFSKEAKPPFTTLIKITKNTPSSPQEEKIQLAMEDVICRHRQELHKAMEHELRSSVVDVSYPLVPPPKEPMNMSARWWNQTRPGMSAVDSLAVEITVEAEQAQEQEEEQAQEQQQEQKHEKKQQEMQQQMQQQEMNIVVRPYTGRMISRLGDLRYIGFDPTDIDTEGKVWTQVMGVGKFGIEDAINLSPAAAIEIMHERESQYFKEHKGTYGREYFRYGFKEDNLPPGFFIRIHEEKDNGKILKEKVLDFDRDLYLQAHQIKNPLTIRVIPSPKKREHIGTLNQFGLDAILDPQDKSNATAAKNFLIELIKTNDPNLAPKIIANFSEKMSLTEVQACLYVFYNEGCSGLTKMSPDNLNANAERWRAFYKDNYRISQFMRQASLGQIVGAEHYQRKLQIAMVAVNPALASKLFQRYGKIFASLSEENIRALFPVLSAQGCEGVEIVVSRLQKIMDVDERNFLLFKNDILDRSENWLDFTSLEAVEAIQGIAAFSENEMSWWLTIVNDYLKTPDVENQFPSHVDLADTYAAFKYFIKEYEAIAAAKGSDEYRSLPENCPFKGIKNIKLGLDRFLTILRNATEFDVQMRIFEQGRTLELGSDQAYYASTQEGFHFVDPNKMVLNMRREGTKIVRPGVHGAPKPQRVERREVVDHFFLRGISALYVGAKEREADAATAHFSDTVSVEEMIILFYRYLAIQTDWASYEKYETILAGIKNAPGSFEEQRKLIFILAFTTTHQKGSQQKIEAQMASLREVLEPLRKEQKILIIDEMMEWYRLKPVITLEDAATLVKVLREVEVTRVHYAAEQLRTYTVEYGDALFKALSNLQYKKSQFPLLEFLKVIEQTKKIDDFLIQNKLIVIASLVSGNAEGWPVFIKAVQAFRAAHGDNNTNRLLDKLLLISAERSAQLPTVSELMSCVDSVSSDPTLYNEGEILLSKLDDYLTQESAIKFCHFESSASLMVVPEDVVGELKKNAQSLVEAAKKLGIDLDPKALEEAPFEYLAKKLNEIRESGVVGKGKITLLLAVVENFFGSNLKKQIHAEVETLKRLDPFEKALLVTACGKFIPSIDRSKMEESLTAFTARVSLLMEQLPKFTQALGALKEKWPADFSEIVKLLASSTSQLGGGCSIDYLAVAFALVHENFEKFPKSILAVLISHPKIALITDPHKFLPLKRIFETSFNNKQKATLLSIAITLQASGLRSTDKINELLGYEKEFPEVFAYLLAAYDDPSGQRGELESLSQNTATVMSWLGKPSQNKKESEHLRKVAKNFFEWLVVAPSVYSLVVETLASAGVSPDKKKPMFFIVAQAMRSLLKDASKLSDKKREDYLKEPMEKLKAIMLTLSTRYTPEDLEKIAHLCSTDPCPSISVLDRLVKEKETIPVDTFISNFIKNPYGDRDLAAQFDTSQVMRVIEGILNLATDQPVSMVYSQRETLFQWFMTVNSLGSNYPIHNHKAAKDLTRDEIQTLITQFTAVIKDPKATDKNKLTAQLGYITLMREVMFRTTGKFPNSTQVIAILNSLMQGGNVLLGVPTGQGKGIVTALSAALLVAQGPKGQTVNVCTSDSELARRDQEEFAPFYHYLNIQHGARAIDHHSPLEDYQVGGVNYSDIAELSLFLSHRQLVLPKPDTSPTSMVLDEADDVIGNKVDFRQAMSLTAQTASQENADAWVYSLLNEYIETDEFKNGKTRGEQVLAAREFIEMHVDPKDRRAAKRLLSKKCEIETNERLNQWLDAARDAKSIYDWQHSDERIRKKEREPYFIGQQTKMISGEAVVSSVVWPTTGSRSNEHAQFSRGVQQFLHARLNSENEKKRGKDKLPAFRIEPETATVVAVNSKNTIDQHQGQEGQRVIAVTATPGGSPFRRELRQKFKMKINKIPSHEISRRVDRPAILLSNEAAHLEKVKEEVIHYLRHGDPILVRCKNATEAEKFYNALQTVFAEHPEFTGDLQLYTGDRTKTGIYKKDDNGHAVSRQPTLEEGGVSEAGYVLRAGVAGCVTVTTLMGRGTDPKPRKRFEEREADPRVRLDVIQTYLGEESEDEQAQGRTARKGAEGETVSLINEEELSGLPIPEAREAMAGPARVDRQFSHHYGDMRNYIFNQFLESYFPKEDDARKAMLRVWVPYFDDIQNSWNTLMQQPHTLDDVDRITDEFCSHACEEWNTTLSELTQMTLRPKDVKAAIKTHALETAHVDIRDRTLDSEPVSSYQLYADLDLNLLGVPKEEHKTDRYIATRQLLGQQLYHLRQMSTFREKLPASKLGEKITENFAEDVRKSFSVLLDALYDAKKAKHSSPLYIVTLERVHQKMMDAVVWSQDEVLQQKVREAHKTHYDDVVSKEVVKKDKVGDAAYLQFLKTNMLRVSPEQQDVKEEKEKDWATNKKMALEALKQYKRAWFKSTDRKDSVNVLISAVEEMKPGDEERLLTSLNSAIIKAMQADSAHDDKSIFKRNTTESRYLSVLEGVRKRVIAGYDADTIDKLVTIEIKDILNIMHTLARKRSTPELADTVYKLGMVLSPHEDKPEATLKEKYIAMLEFANAHPDIRKLPRVERHLYELMVHRCQDQAHFFKQGKELSKIVSEVEREGIAQKSSDPSPEPPKSHP